MPNHITNYLKITGRGKTGAKQLKELYNKIYSLKADPDNPDNSVPTVDFNGTVPMPEELKNTVSGSENAKPDWQKKRSKELIQKYGADNWYDWAVRNWGTKWGAYKATEPDQIKGGYVFCFQTAWSPPDAWLKTTAAQYPTLIFEDKWHDEGGGAGCLTLWHDNGKLQVSEKAIPEHEWLYEFDSDYREEYDFIVKGNYKEVIKTYQNGSTNLQKYLLKRIKDEDLPLFIHFKWYDRDSFEQRLKKMK